MNVLCSRELKQVSLSRLENCGGTRSVYKAFRPFKSDRVFCPRLILTTTEKLSELGVKLKCTPDYLK